jgi:hypothetical protein
MRIRMSAVLAVGFVVGLGSACTHFADTADLRVVEDSASSVDAPALETSTATDTAVADTHVPRVDAVADGAECDPELDQDGDGHATRASGFTCADDCNDGNVDVFPGQSKWFAFASDITDFDWNCSGVEEKRFTVQGKCETTDTGCAFTEGWLDAVPACGVTGDWLTGCTKLATGACGAGAGAIERRAQECH